MARRSAPSITCVVRTARTEIYRITSREFGWSQTFALYIDGEYIHEYDTQNDAEHEGAMRMEEEMRRAA